MMKQMLSPIIHIKRKFARFYRTYRSTTIVKRPPNTVQNPIMRSRDHDFEVVRNGGLPFSYAPIFFIMGVHHAGVDSPSPLHGAPDHDCEVVRNG